jgi:hypothetical protein
VKSGVRMKNKQTVNVWLPELFLNISPKHFPKKKLNFFFLFKTYYKITENRPKKKNLYTNRKDPQNTKIFR